MEYYMQGDLRVFSILGIVFLFLGVYLLVYRIKYGKMFEQYAANKGFSYRKEDKDFEKLFNETLSIRDDGLVRSFNMVKDIISIDDGIYLLRCIELLDLNPYRKAAVTHYGRICVLFDMDEKFNLYFMFYSNGRYINIYPKDKDMEKDEYFLQIKKILDNHIPRCPMSISCYNGKALLYLQPLRVGSENEADMDYLIKIAKAIRDVNET